MNRLNLPVRELDCLLNRGRLAAAPDAELVQRFVQDRDEFAFEELVHRHGPMVLGVCKRRLDHQDEADDAFQATFLVLVRRADSLGRDPHIGAWLHAVAIRVADRLRASSWKRQRMVPVGDVIEPKVVDDLERLEVRLAIDEEIARLPQRERTVVNLCWLEGVTHQQAAAQLGVPLGTVKSRLATARGRLQDRLSRRGVAPSLLLIGDAPLLRLPASLVERTLLLARSISGPGLAALRGVAANELALRVISEMPRFTASRSWLLGLTLTAGLIAASGFSLQPSDPPRPSPEAVQAPRPRTDRFGDPLPEGAVDRIGTIRYRQAEGISRIAFSPDGQTIITNEGDRTIKLWNAGEGRPVRSIDPRLDSIRDFQLSPDGKTIAAVGFYFDPLRRLMIHQMVFLDVATGRSRFRDEWEERGGSRELAYSPDGQCAATLGDDGTLRIWSTDNGKLRLKLKVGEQADRGLAFSPDRRLLAAASYGNAGKPYALHLIEQSTGKVLRTIDSLSSFVTSVAFAPDGRTVAVAASNDGAFSIWDVETGRELGRMSVKAQNINVVMYAPDGTSLATIADSGELSIWNARSGQKLRAINLPRTFWPAAVYSPDGQKIAVCGGSSVLHLINVADGRDLYEVSESHQADVHAIAFSPDGKLVVTAGDDGQARAWDFATPAATLTCSPASELGPNDRTFRRWPTAFDGRLVARRQGASLGPSDW